MLPIALFILLFKITSSEIIVDNHTICDLNIFFEKFLLKTKLKCINIHDHFKFDESITNCLWKHFEENLNIPVSHIDEINDQTCSTHIIIAAEKLKFEELNFPPFTQILLVNTVLDNLNQPFIFLKSLNIFGVKLLKEENHLIASPNLYSLTERKMYLWNSSNIEYLNMERFIDILLKNELKVRTLRIAFRDCSPSVLKYENLLDGVEVRIIKEIAKHWELKWYERFDWDQIRESTMNNISDISMCAIWLNEANARQLDLSNAFDTSCGTLIVQKPKLLNKASYIYEPFQRIVWLTFLASVLITSLLLKIITNLGLRHNPPEWASSKFNSFTISFLEVINTVTSHGVTRFPVQIPIKILITSWMLMVLLAGTFYTTGYTSILTSPPSSKPIDTFDDFIEQGYSWGEMEFNDFTKEVEGSKYSKYLMPVYRNTTHNELIDLVVNSKYGGFVVVSANKFVSFTEKYSNFILSLRLMKECLFNYYGTFGYRKKSGFKFMFDGKISRQVFWVFEHK